jgi:hypothetical protein
MPNTLLIASLALGLSAMAAAAAQLPDREAVYRAYLNFEELVEGGQMTPNWTLGKSSFWYAEGGPQDRVIYRVESGNNTKEPLFDIERLRAVLTDTLGYEPAGNGVPFATLQFVAPSIVQLATRENPVPTTMN